MISKIAMTLVLLTISACAAQPPKSCTSLKCMKEQAEAWKKESEQRQLCANAIARADVCRFSTSCEVSVRYKQDWLLCRI